MAAATAATTYQAKLTRPRVFLWRMSLFLILAILLALNALRVWLDRRHRRAELAQAARDWDEFTEAWERERR